MVDALGLDIGGANLKAAHTRGVGRTVPFALWKKPEGLTAALRALISEMPAHELLAVTMTGESCDCYTSKREGVAAILDSVERICGRVAALVWTTYGCFLPLVEAREEPLRVASANWLAGAALAGNHANVDAALYIDIGSTTTDIVELWKGKPVPSAWTDMERLKCGELVYTGVKRTPVCAVLGPEVVAELFATMRDVYVMLDLQPEDEDDTNTADGRAATKHRAHIRLARMIGGDGELIGEEQTLALARQALRRQKECIAAAIDRVRQRMPEAATVNVISGSGEFLALQIATERGLAVVSLAERLGPQNSEAACAYAVALLAAQPEMQQVAARCQS